MSELSLKLSFEEKLKEKIKGSIGELMSDEDLSKITARGIEEAFFQPRVVNKGSYQERQLKPLIHEVVEEIFRIEVNVQVKKWFKNNPDKVREIVDEQVKAGLGGAVVAAVNNIFSTQMNSFRYSVEDILSRMGK